MPKSKDTELIGRVTQVHGNNNFEVELEINGHSRLIRCVLSGRMRQYAISILAEDRVRVVLPPPYDIGRIVYREK